MKLKFRDHVYPGCHVLLDLCIFLLVRWVLSSGSGVPNPPPSNEKESAGPQVLSPEEAAQLMLPTILNLKPSDSGKLLNNDGTMLPY